MTTPADPLRSIPYAGDALHVLGECAGMAVCEMSVPAGFPGPPPHVHHGFDEAIYVVDGELLVVTGRSDARPVPAGSLVLAPRGTRHTFRNPSVARVGPAGPGPHRRGVPPAQQRGGPVGPTR